MKSLRLNLKTGIAIISLMACSFTQAQAFSSNPALAQQTLQSSQELLVKVQYDPRHTASKRDRVRTNASGLIIPVPRAMGLLPPVPQRPTPRPQTVRRNIAPVIAAGAIGLAAGSVIAQTYAQQQMRPVPVRHPHPRPVYRPQPTYVQQPIYAPQPTYVPQPVYRPQPVYQPQVVYHSYPSYQSYPIRPVYEEQTASLRPQPWSEEWYESCSQRYRTFNPQNGTYLAYDGQRYFCQ